MSKAFKLLGEHLEEAAASVLLVVMVTISFANVALRNLSSVIRYFLPNASLSFAFAEELTVYLFVWMTLLGTALAFKHGANMVVVFFNEKFPKFARKHVYIFSTCLTVLFFAVLCYLGIQQVQDEILLEAKTESIYMPLWYFTVSIPVGSCLIIVRAVQKAAQVLRDGAY